MITRIAFVADIHHGRDTFTKKGTAALGLLDRAVDAFNAAGCHGVVDLGDRISDETLDRDRALQGEVAERFFRLTPPRHHVSGNHDSALTLDEHAAILEAPVHSRALVVGAVRLVFWQPDVTLTMQRGLRLASGDLDALEHLLGADDRPTLLVSHVPLSGHGQTGNYYFERNPGHATYAEVADIRRVIAAAPCPVVAIAGHVHWNTLTVVDGTPHITLQSLTEAFTTGEAAASLAVAEIDEGTIRWTVSGLDPFAVTLPWPSAKPRWTAPLASFAELDGDPALTDDRSDRQPSGHLQTVRPRQARHA